MIAQRRHDSAVMEALEDGASLTRREMMNITSLSPEALDDALWRLVGTCKIKAVPGGQYRAVDQRHSRAVRLGQFVSRIPRMGGA